MLRDHARAEDARPLALAESLTTRLCHDMAGLVATLSGTLELVLEDQGVQSEAGSLAAEAARAMAVRSACTSPCAWAAL